MQTFKRPLTKSEEEYYIEKSLSGDLDARNLLVEYNLRLVAHIAKKYQSNSRSSEDLISIGTIGLIKAINTYDNSKGCRLVTYASRCIENELLMRLRQERKESREISLYEPIGTDKEGNEINLMDIVSQTQTNDDIIDNIICDESIRRLKEIFPLILSDREQEIISMRFGFCGPMLTQKQIADRLNISRSYVSRIEKKALIKLRDALSE